MTPTATYIAEENCLQELPQMEEPIPPRLSYNSQAGFEAAMKIIEATFSDYNAHLATLRKIPCDPSCKGLWADQQKVVEGKDYEVREESYCLCHHCNDQGFMTGTEHACRYCNPDGSWRNFSDNYRGRRLVVFPLLSR